ncbi:S8 family serine peptidase [Pseudoalteromonas luteoviolacea]|uniref:Subtilisin-like serine protease n=1 Tax=Pseudoalteromonas luteoviolacea (strain 2ta16) TaxID=1353533 RepID=V4JHF9_PSEL2|nr:S8 family serine peptidase [Pseudoalteromonas luteoviolacea]ESP94352.1 subtilisin-like serine protease [Pseudoalteromonas luteoviolacea 2ta16]KZN36107.1 hypothetical protein N483_22850 [Pseudoalteromonas luteoviolacea NCIMB 1944]
MNNAKVSFKPNRITAWGLVLSLSFFSHLIVAGQQSKHVAIEDNRYIVTFNAPKVQGLSVTQQLEHAKGYLNIQAEKLSTQPQQHLLEQYAMALTLTPDQYLSLKNHPDVQSIEVDPKRYLSAQTTPYGIRMVEADLLRDIGAPHRKVCILDTGYTLGHPDLPNLGITGSDGYGEHNTGHWYQDGHGHGTHVAGTVAAIGNNDLGVVGVNPSGTLGLHIVKVFNNGGGWAYGSDIAAAIYQCVAAGAQITSMSLGGGQPSEAERIAFNDTYAQGVLHIAAAGNSGVQSQHYPASYDNVVAVAAVDEQGERASFSTHNDQVELAAPGVDVLSTLNSGDYGTMSGTSMATPHVSGVAALIWGHHPNCSNAQIRNALQATAQDRGELGRDDYYGFGIVKAFAANEYLKNLKCQPVTGLPMADFTHEAVHLTVSFQDASHDDQGIVSYFWEFGDGNSSTQRSPTHAYAKEGVYVVKLKVTNTDNIQGFKVKQLGIDDGIAPICEDRPLWNSRTEYRKGDKVKYQNNKYTAIHWGTGAQPAAYPNVWQFDGTCTTNDGAPTAHFTYQAEQLTLHLIDSSSDDGEIVTYLWDFGDGFTSQQGAVSHQYAKAGNYLVTLRVADNEGLSAEFSQQIQIGEKPPGCTGSTPWSATVAYGQGKTVHLNDIEYRARWWNRGIKPAQNHGAGQPWAKLDSCL